MFLGVREQTFRCLLGLGLNNKKLRLRRAYSDCKAARGLQAPPLVLLRPPPQEAELGETREPALETSPRSTCWRPSGVCNRRGATVVGCTDRPVTSPPNPPTCEGNTGEGDQGTEGAPNG